MALGIRLIEDEKHLPLSGICCERYPSTAKGLEHGEWPSLSASLTHYLSTWTNAMLAHIKMSVKTDFSANKLDVSYARFAKLTWGINLK